jgi:hypothetical protein
VDRLLIGDSSTIAEITTRSTNSHEATRTCFPQQIPLRTFAALCVLCGKKVF